ncbi:unnamed protein product [Closterium sp. NIES-64]|nr:unnamed protein product [Closterium sp. NIES-64]CAI5970718.1 unnamed protein product [Closterium sp. NIES-65]
MPTVAEMTRLVLTWHPDLLEATVADDDASDYNEADDAEGGGSAGLARLLVAALKPALASYWAEERRRAAAFTSGSTTETRRQVREAVESRVNAMLGQLVLYAHGAAAFNSDEDAATATLISRHVLRTSAFEPVDLLLHAVLLDHDVITAQDDASSTSSNGGGSSGSGMQAGEQQESTGAEAMSEEGAGGGMGREQKDKGAAASVLGSTPIIYTPARRAALAKLLPGGGPRERAQRMIAALEGKEVEAVLLPLEEVAEKDLGIRLKRPDKKAERALLFSMKKSLQLQLEAEEDAVATLPLIVALLFMQAHNRALQAPGRALSAVITHLKPSLSPADFSSLSTLHSAVVAALGKRAAGGRGPAGGGEEGKEGGEERVDMAALLKGLKELTLGKAKEGKAGGGDE